jgi:hypothetical protein
LFRHMDRVRAEPIANFEIFEIEFAHDR